MLVAQAVRAPSDPLALARALADRAQLSLLASGAPGAARGARSFLAVDPDGESDALDPLEGAPAPERGPLASVPRFVGLLPYEPRRVIERAAWTPAETRPAPPAARTRWLRYPAVLVIDHLAGEVMAVGTSAAAVEDLRRLAERAPPPPPPIAFTARDDEPLDRHRARIERAIELVVAGDLYQVNLARRIALTLSEPGCARPSTAAYLEAFARLARAAPTPFGAALLWGDVNVLSTSPELFLDATPTACGASFARLLTAPIKGTRARGADARDDAALAAALDADPKERAELAMIVDVERNDVARVSVPGSTAVLGPPRVASHGPVHHRTALVAGSVRPGTTRAAVFEAMLPSGSVTGAPKVRAMEVIASLEPCRRGLYTGALGFVGHDGAARLSMAIRCAVFGAEGGGEYLVGGGIVADSDPEREVAETGWKAAQLARLVGESAPPLGDRR